MGSSGADSKGGNTSYTSISVCNKIYSKFNHSGGLQQVVYVDDDIQIFSKNFVSSQNMSMIMQHCESIESGLTHCVS